MRRWMHVLLIGVLALGLSLDSASACRHWRRACRPRCCRPVQCVAVCQPRTCCPPATTCQPCDLPSTGVVIESAPTSSVKTDAGKPVARESVIAKPSEPAPLPPMPIAPPSAPARPKVAPVEPKPDVTPIELPPTIPPTEETAPKKQPEPVKPAPIAPAQPESDLFPEESKPAVEAKPMPKVEVPEPQEANLFGAEKPAEKAPAAKTTEPPPAKEKPAPEKKKKEENLFDEFGADEPAEPSKETLVPVGTDDASAEPKPLTTDEPKNEPADAPAEPADADDPFAGPVSVPDEPIRRWVDDSGTHETVARLVEVLPDGVRLLKASGAHATVPMSRLSDHDRLYVTCAKARLAAASTAPQATETAGL